MEPCANRVIVVRYSIRDLDLKKRAQDVCADEVRKWKVTWRGKKRLCEREKEIYIYIYIQIDESKGNEEPATLLDTIN